ncbi:MAG: hypothetical protein H6662_14965 [Ardenticatenaceae bacterium]|nr:hypothetical protein [Anaerolineales bacterium]MCB8922887.1 hypothetical protein [Ardenticatenaceae bacterium]MCB8990376.1 hypothetical protein [Ardenticatenaceae bacterium]
MAVIQIVRFRTNSNVEETAFRTLNERFQREVAPTLPGLVRREATVSEDGEWVLVLRYTDMESAHKAGRSDTSDISQAFMQMIDMSSMSASFYTIISE